MDRENEKDIILLVKSGDMKAFEKVLSFYEKRIFSYAYRLLSNKHDAEDCTQDTFIKLYKNIVNIDPEKSFKSWLYRIATNTAYDYLRKRNNAPEPLGLEEINPIFETTSEEDPYLNTEEERGLEEALSRLKPVSKTVLEFFYRQELTYKEIAGVMNLPINTVKTLLRRAKNELKTTLEKKSHD